MGGKPLECGVDTDLDEVDEVEEEDKADEIDGVVEAVEAEALKNMVEIEAFEAEMKRKFSEKKIEGEFLGEGDEGEFPEEVMEGGDLSAKMQLLKSLTRGRVGRGNRKSVTTGSISAERRKKLSSVDLGKEVGFAGKNRPRKRADCVSGQRPCPWVGCRHHLYLDVNSDTWGIKHNFPGLEVDQLPVSCSLDVADVGGMRAEGVGVLLNVTGQAINGIVWGAVDKIIDSRFGKELKELFSEL